MSWEERRRWFIGATAGQQLEIMDEFIESFILSLKLPTEKVRAFRQALVNLDYDHYRYNMLIPLGNALSSQDQTKRDRVRRDIAIPLHSECSRWDLSYPDVEAILDELFSSEWEENQVQSLR
jgi:hypothetical protein